MKLIFYYCKIMKAIAVLMLFIGMFLVLQGYYSQRSSSETLPTVQVKFVPRTVFDEQWSSDPVSKHFKGMFDDTMVLPTDQYDSNGLSTTSTKPAPPPTQQAK